MLILFKQNFRSKIFSEHFDVKTTPLKLLCITQVLGWPENCIFQFDLISYFEAIYFVNFQKWVLLTRKVDV